MKSSFTRNLVLAMFVSYAIPVRAETMEFVIFTGETSAANSMEDVKRLSDTGQKFVCAATGEATRMACNLLAKRFSLRLEINEVRGSGPAAMMARSNQAILLPLSIEVAQRMNKSYGIRPIATTGPSIDIFGQPVPSISSSSGVQVAEVEQARKAKSAAQQKALDEQVRAFQTLGNCGIGETVYHRELLTTTSSSGNALADIIWSSQNKAQYLVEYEAVVEAIVGAKVKTTINGYRVKQLAKGGYVDAQEMRAKVSATAEKLVGKTQFYERSRCSN